MLFFFDIRLVDCVYLRMKCAFDSGVMVALGLDLAQQGVALHAWTTDTGLTKYNVFSFFHYRLIELHNHDAN